MRIPLLRQTVLLTTLTAFCGQTALASVGEASLWAERRRAQTQRQNHTEKPTQYASLPAMPSTPNLFQQLPSLSKPLAGMPKPAADVADTHARWPTSLRSTIAALPQDRTKVQEIHDAGTATAPIVILQDVHMNVEAQTNIAGALQELINGGNVGMIGVEGAFEKIDFSRHRAFPRKDITKSVMDDFLKVKKMAAPSYVGITSETEPPLFLGIDDRAHHQANVDAFLASRSLKDKVKADLTKAQIELTEKKKTVFSKDLLAFDAFRSAYQKGSVGLGAYLKKLAAANENVPMAAETFLQAYAMEQKLDIPRVENERRRVIEKLASKLTPVETESLISKSMAYRLGKLGFGDYYHDLKRLCESKGIFLRETPAFDDYIRYVFLSDAINANDLFAAVDKMEEAAFKKLVQTPEQDGLVKESTALALAEKLVEFELTPQEWEKYQRIVLRSSVHQFSELKPFENFYEEADARSHLMTENLLNLRTNKLRTENSLVLVVGGFHTPEITRILRDKKISYIVATPKLTKIEEGPSSSYLNEFAREKTPLDRMFVGEKLFINNPDLNISPDRPLFVASKAMTAAAHGFAGITGQIAGTDTTVTPEANGVAMDVKTQTADNKAVEVVVERAGKSLQFVQPSQSSLYGAMAMPRWAIKTLATVSAGLMILLSEKVANAAWKTGSTGGSLLDNQFVYWGLFIIFIASFMGGPILVFNTFFYVKDRYFSGNPLTDSPLEEPVSPSLERVAPSGVALREKPPTRTIGTDMTLNYGGLERWTPERILIDLIQNHLPSDSHGKKIFILFRLPDGTQVPLRKAAELKYQKGMSLIIADDGIGYDVDHLRLFLSTKTGEERGKFGEGLKIAVTSALRMRMNITLASRKWKARADKRPIVVNAGKKNEIRTEQVVFDVGTTKGITGSQTTLTDMSEPFFEIAKNIENLVLPLKKYQPLIAVSGVGQVVRKSEGKTIWYADGLKVEEMESDGIEACLYDYNFFGMDLGRDRDSIDRADAATKIKGLLQEQVTPEMAEDILRTAGKVEDGERIVLPTYWDINNMFDSYFSDRNTKPPHPKVWVNAFQKVYGKDAILSSSRYYQLGDSTKKALADGKTVVRLPASLTVLLQNCGIFDDIESRIENSDDVETSLGLDYRSEAWGPERILLDAVQNHMPEDSGGTIVRAEFAIYGKDEWIAISEIGNYSSDKITAFRVSDNGRGYDSRLLGLFYSTKGNNDEARGKYGEGIKMLSAACLRSGMEIQLNSQNWEAVAGQENESIRSWSADKGVTEQEIPYLKYSVVHYRSGWKPGSQTILRKLSPEFIETMKRLPSLVLYFNPSYRPAARVPKVGEIKSFEPGLFVQGMAVPAVVGQGLRILFEYNFFNKKLIVSPDRNVVNTSLLGQEIGNLLAGVDNPAVIARVIQAAADEEDSYPEFQDFGDRDDFKAPVWREALRIVYGDQKIALVTNASLDPDVLIALRHMGYRPVNINSSIASTLHSIGVPYDYELVEPEFSFVDDSVLSESEQKILALTKEVDRMVQTELGIEFTPAPFRIFDKATSKTTGLEMPILAFYHTQEEYIAFKRALLSDPEEFLSAYIEELSHQLSNAGDYTRELYNFTVKMFVRQIMNGLVARGVLDASAIHHYSPQGDSDKKMSAVPDSEFYSRWIAPFESVPLGALVSGLLVWTATSIWTALQEILSSTPVAVIGLSPPFVLVAIAVGYFVSFFVAVPGFALAHHYLDGIRRFFNPNLKIERNWREMLNGAETINNWAYLSATVAGLFDYYLIRPFFLPDLTAMDALILAAIVYTVAHTMGHFFWNKDADPAARLSAISDPDDDTAEKLALEIHNQFVTSHTWRDAPDFIIFEVLQKKFHGSESQIINDRVKKLHDLIDAAVEGKTDPVKLRDDIYVELGALYAGDRVSELYETTHDLAKALAAKGVSTPDWAMYRELIRQKRLPARGSIGAEIDAILRKDVVKFEYFHNADESFLEAAIRHVDEARGDVLAARPARFVFPVKRSGAVEMPLEREIVLFANGDEQEKAGVSISYDSENKKVRVIGVRGRDVPAIPLDAAHAEFDISTIFPIGRTDFGTDGVNMEAFADSKDHLNAINAWSRKGVMVRVTLRGNQPWITVQVLGTRNPIIMAGADFNYRRAARVLPQNAYPVVDPQSPVPGRPGVATRVPFTGYEWIASHGFNLRPVVNETGQLEVEAYDRNLDFLATLENAEQQAEPESGMGMEINFVEQGLPVIAPPKTPSAMSLAVNKISQDEVVLVVRDNDTGNGFTVSQRILGIKEETPAELIALIREGTGKKLPVLKRVAHVSGDKSAREDDLMYGADEIEAMVMQSDVMLVPANGFLQVVRLRHFGEGPEREGPFAVRTVKEAARFVEQSMRLSDYLRVQSFMEVLEDHADTFFVKKDVLRWIEEGTVLMVTNGSHSYLIWAPGLTDRTRQHLFEKRVEVVEHATPVVLPSNVREVTDQAEAIHLIRLEPMVVITKQLALGDHSMAVSSTLGVEEAVQQYMNGRFHIYMVNEHAQFVRNKYGGNKHASRRGQNIFNATVFPLLLASIDGLVGHNGAMAAALFFSPFFVVSLYLSFRGLSRDPPATTVKGETTANAGYVDLNSFTKTYVDLEEAFHRFVNDALPVWLDEALAKTFALVGVLVMHMPFVRRMVMARVERAEARRVARALARGAAGLADITPSARLLGISQFIDARRGLDNFIADLDRNPEREKAFMDLLRDEVAKTTPRLTEEAANDYLDSMMPKRHMGGLKLSDPDMINRPFVHISDGALSKQFLKGIMAEAGTSRPVKVLYKTRQEYDLLKTYRKNNANLTNLTFESQPDQFLLGKRVRLSRAGKWMPIIRSAIVILPNGTRLDTTGVAPNLVQQLTILTINELLQGVALTGGQLQIKDRMAKILARQA